MIIAIEGINLAGKTTQVDLLSRALESKGRKPLTTAFPTTATPIGGLIRSVLRKEMNLSSEPLFALFSANRLEIKPMILDAIGGGGLVVSDRYSMSEIAYGAARGLDVAWLRALESRMPPADLVVLLDIDYRSALKRKTVNHPSDAFEEDFDFIESVRQQYVELAGVPIPGSRWEVLDATLPVNVLHELILTAVLEVLGD